MHSRRSLDRAAIMVGFIRHMKERGTSAVLQAIHLCQQNRQEPLRCLCSPSATSARAVIPATCRHVMSVTAAGPPKLPEDCLGSASVIQIGAFAGAWQFQLTTVLLVYAV